MRAWTTMISAVASVALFATSASAVPVGSPAPLPGFDPDAGWELFTPNNGVAVFEVSDVMGPASISEFSFYYASDPGTLVTIFAADDQLASGQGVIDFVGGTVFDIDSSTVQSVFTPSAGPIGFAFSFDTDPSGPGGETVIFSQATLNPGGTDLVGTYGLTGNPQAALITLENSSAGEPFAIEFVSGIDPIPEPSSVVSFCAGLLLVGVAIQRYGAPQHR